MGLVERTIFERPVLSGSLRPNSVSVVQVMEVDYEHFILPIALSVSGMTKVQR